ncbi:hypothetical protein [Mycobacterium sp. D16R24]|uniref:hypothetical protein n=1 Tax=Mycobacterium sp. D16R24 TaxID=1855656 RepID=UPI000992DD5F|nr:hypothetical protein [Mycobacterium sp. D16R24]
MRGHQRRATAASEGVRAGLARLAQSDPGHAEELTWQWLDELGKAGNLAALEAIFLMGTPLVGADGLTQARYLASPYGRLVDSLLRWGLGRWWQGHRFSDGGRCGISNTHREFRWAWRLMFPGYPRPGGCRGEEVFDFRTVTIEDSKTPGHRVTLLDWHLPPGKMNRVVTAAVRPVARWFVWDLTRSELVALAGGDIILARIPVRIPFGRRWRTTTFYMHRWVTGGPSLSTSELSMNCPSRTPSEESQ